LKIDINGVVPHAKNLIVRVLMQILRVDSAKRKQHAIKRAQIVYHEL
jgi:hypothetical protein